MKLKFKAIKTEILNDFLSVSARMLANHGNQKAALLFFELLKFGRICQTEQFLFDLWTEKEDKSLEPKDFRKILHLPDFEKPQDRQTG